MQYMNFRNSSKFEYEETAMYKKRYARVAPLVADGIASEEETRKRRRKKANEAYRDQYMVAHSILKSMGVEEL